MTTLRVLFARIRGLFGVPASDRALNDEIAAHIDMLADDYVRRGMTAAAAQAAARREFGGVDQVKETYRDQRGLSWLTDLVRDIRYGWRLLAKDPGFTAVAVLSLAIGIGANCAVFTFADGFLLRPLPVPNPGDVITVGSTMPAGETFGTSYRDYVDLRDRARSFEGLAAFTSSASAWSTEPHGPSTARIGMLVSGNFFRVMHVTPPVGRDFRADEDQVPGRDTVVILGHEFWTREFDADERVLGRTVHLNGIPFTVIGIAPPGFTGLDQFTRYEFYAPLMMWPRLIESSDVPPLEARDFRRLTVKGRLQPGVSASEAQAELTGVARDLERAYPATNNRRGMTLRTELEARVRQAAQLRNLIVLLTVLAAAVLCVACANVAGLLASRAPTRAREIAMRLALGAGRLRIVRQLVTECLLMAMIGGALSLGVGYAAVGLFRQFRIPTELPIAASFELDRRALAVSFAVALISVVAFGLAPAFRSARAELNSVLKATDVAGLGRRRLWGREILVAGQVAVAVILLALATFTFRDFRIEIERGPGFRTDHMLMMGFAPGLQQYSPSQTQQLFEQVVAGARLVPGVRSVTLTSYIPMDGGVDRVTVVPEGFRFPPGIDSASVPNSVVDEQYFETLGLSVLRGRGLRATDTAATPDVAVVNETFAQHYWPDQDPIGKRFRLKDNTGPWVEILGIVKTTKYVALTESPLEFIYVPFRQRPQPFMAMLTRSIGDPATVITPLREMVRRLDAGLTIHNVRAFDENYRMRAVTILNVIVTLVSAMGAMGLTLAIVGLYGLVAYGVSRRTREIGIRMALGAGQSDVVRMVLRHGIVLAGAGLVIGLLASAGVSRALTALIPDRAGAETSTNLVSFALVAVTVMVVTMIATYIPARRAARLDPSRTLRYE